MTSNVTQEIIPSLFLYKGKFVFDLVKCSVILINNNSIFNFGSQKLNLIWHSFILELANNSHVNNNSQTL